MQGPPRDPPWTSQGPPGDPQGGSGPPRGQGPPQGPPGSPQGPPRVPRDPRDPLNPKNLWGLRHPGQFGVGQFVGVHWCSVWCWSFFLGGLRCQAPKNVPLVKLMSVSFGCGSGGGEEGGEGGRGRGITVPGVKKCSVSSDKSMYPVSFFTLSLNFRSGPQNTNGKLMYDGPFSSNLSFR